MLPFQRLLERIGFHLPYSHTWLAERDALRNESRKLREERDRMSTELGNASAHVAELTRQLWKPPGHFYSPIPDVRNLAADKDRVFSFPPRIPDVDFNEERQVELLTKFREWYPEQPFTAQKTPGRRYYFDNENYSYSDGIILYFMMRLLQPKRIVEVGSGFSSCAMLDVNELLFENAIDCTFIDPYPELLLKLMTGEDRLRTRVFGQRVQDVEARVFEELGPNDILFIDSSHVVKTGSDVNHLVFKVLPLLQKGVCIHFHDIFYPFEYPDWWVLEGRAWNEVYLLHSFLAHNSAYRIEFLITYLMHRFPHWVETEFPLFKNAIGGSLWLRKES